MKGNKNTFCVDKNVIIHKMRKLLYLGRTEVFINIWNIQVNFKYSTWHEGIYYFLTKMEITFTYWRTTKLAEILLLENMSNYMS